MTDSKAAIATAVFSGCSAITSIFTLLVVLGIRTDAAEQSAATKDALTNLTTITQVISSSTAHLSTGPMQERWEYMVTALPDPSFEKDSKTLGDAGWEIVTARRASNANDEFSYEVIAKRRTAMAASP